jgi:hypothetical protein
MRKDRVLIWALGVAVLTGLVLQATLGVPAAGTTESAAAAPALDVVDAAAGAARFQLATDSRPALVAASRDAAPALELTTQPTGALAEDGVAIAGRVLVVLALIAAVAVALLVRGSS